eukprot:TRINITY_DN9020_c0_g1_i1.p1 TRINITY_DN9020_c0_g1~~TRINITY_DN9020_c0_g1_i1.p1  ORF type:complete len:388 (-),score=162.89 TRINITY_DN9020_c0_g1_i1:137-1300(-)
MNNNNDIDEGNKVIDWEKGIEREGNYQHDPKTGKVIAPSEEFQQRGKDLPEWKDVGTSSGLRVWRVEDFELIEQSEIGTFYCGDSYVVLHTYTVGNRMAYDIHFWLGVDSTTDERGTAAYKTVELDDLLHGAAVQYREVQHHESRRFQSYFKKGIRILEGGVESGFNIVKPKEYSPRLLHVKGTRKTVSAMQVHLHHSSLNSGDCFILDNGLTIYQFNGTHAGIFEKNKSSMIVRALDEERKSAAKVIVLDENDEDPDHEEFWQLLGGEHGVAIKTKEEGGSDSNLSAHGFTKKMFKLSDETGQIEFTLIAEDHAISKDLLDTNDVFIVDNGCEIFAWCGKNCSYNESRLALVYAQDYLEKYNRPHGLPLVRLVEGIENDLFDTSFN